MSSHQSREWLRSKQEPSKLVKVLVLRTICPQFFDCCRIFFLVNSTMHTNDQTCHYLLMYSPSGRWLTKIRYSHCQMAVGKELEIIVKPFRSCPNENSNFFDDSLFLKTDKKSIGFRKSDEAWILFPDLFILSNLRHFDLSFFTFFFTQQFSLQFFFHQK